MLFKRRNPLPLLEKIKNILWPGMGWKRTAKYYKNRTIRIQDSAHAIAAGLAIGCAVSWTPAFGTHLIQCLFFCWLFRANWLAAFLGTAFGNPWTFPVLWWISYQVGHGLFDLMGWGMMFQELNDPIPLETMPDSPVRTLLPMLIGGFVMGIVTFPLFYYPFYYFIKGAQAARKMRITRRAHIAAQEITRAE
jgi:hypothetical protein